MPLLFVLMLLAGDPTPGASIDATIGGTAEPLEVQLLVRDDAGNWKPLATKSLLANARRVRFDDLQPGVYQLLLRGPSATEQLSTKIGLGRGDARRITVAVEPFLLTGRVTLGGTSLGEGGLLLKHREFQSRLPVLLAPDGTFRVPLWQRGAFSYNVRGPALPTDYSSATELEGSSPGPLVIDIPDGRISGILRDASSGRPIDAATVALQTNLDDREEHARLTTGPDGRFDFAGIKPGRHTVRIDAPRYLEPEPIVFELTRAAPLRELDLRLDPGGSVPVIVIDKNHDPAANAKIFVVADARLRARGTTDEDGRADVAVPPGEPATLFIVPEEGLFAMKRIARDGVQGRLQIHLPSSASSLLIRAETTDGRPMPPFSLLMRYDGELVPVEVAEELAEVQGLRLAASEGEARLQNIPSGSYEFWPYRSKSEAEAIVAAGSTFLAPIQVNVRMGENRIAVKFASRTARR